MKVCTKCKEEKASTEFGVRRSSSDGLDHSCKPCVRARNKSYYEADKGRAARQRADNYARNRETLLEYRKGYYLKNKAKIEARRVARKAEDPEKFRARRRTWAKNNREKINARLKVRRATCWKFKAKELHRGLLRSYLARAKEGKTAKTSSVLGYCANKFRQRIEFQFKPGMSWSNHGEWHIDHKIPVAWFRAKGEGRPEVINALCNLQPLWAKDNLIKRDKHPLRRNDEHYHTVY